MGHHRREFARHGEARSVSQLSFSFLGPLPIGEIPDDEDHAGITRDFIDTGGDEHMPEFSCLGAESGFHVAQTAGFSRFGYKPFSISLRRIDLEVVNGAAN